VVLDSRCVGQTQELFDKYLGHMRSQISYLTDQVGLLVVAKISVVIHLVTRLTSTIQLLRPLTDVVNEPELHFNGRLVSLAASMAVEN
jgi:site-specific recombinase